MTESPEPGRRPESFFQELRRRHVVKVGVAYAVTGWLLLQVGSILFPAFGAPGWAIRLLFGLLLLGLPAALLLAWAFEMTPEGVRRTPSADVDTAPGEAGARRRASSLNTITIVVLAAAVGVLGWRQFLHHPAAASGRDAGGRMALPAAGASASGSGGFHAAAAPASGSGTTATPERSIAVLPFVNASGDSSDRYFSDGLSEEMIIALNRYPRLRVIGRESSFQFRGRDLDSKVIGRKLGVAHLLEGSVSREGDRVRVRTELVNAADGSTLWSHQYDRPYRNLFAVQDDLTEAVASALEARLLGTGRPAQTDHPPGGSLAAYKDYLEGNFSFDRHTEAGWRRAIRYYRSATALDRRYAAAYAALSNTWTDLGQGFPAGVARRRALDSARVAADSALALDPDLAAAHEARGLLLRDQLDWLGSEAEFRRALELAPGDPGARTLMTLALATDGKLEDALRLQRRALTTNPLNWYGYLHLSNFLAGLGRYDEAASAARRAISIRPTAHGPRAQLAVIDVLAGHSGEALRDARAVEDPVEAQWALALAYTAAGDSARADSALDRLVADGRDRAAYRIAEAYGLRHEPDRVFAWLDRAWKRRDQSVGWLLSDPFLRPYRKDPRFIAFRQKAGLPAPEQPEPEAPADASPAAPGG